MSTPTSNARRAVAFLALLILGFGCAPSEGPTAPAMDPEERERREAKAAALFDEASREPVPRKIELYRRIVGFFPETKVAPDARFSLVHYLLHRESADPGAALEAAIAFGHAHPDDVRVAETFRWLDTRAGDQGELEMRRRVQEAWSAHMARAREGARGADPGTRARIWLDSADVARRQRRREDALRLLGEAETFDVPAQDLRLEILWYLATLQAEVPELREEAEKTYQQALVLARAGVRGPNVEMIEERLRDLRGN